MSARAFSLPEDRLILALCGRAVPVEIVEERLRDPGLDWARVVGTARKHKVAPLVLSRALSFALPPDVRSAIAGDGRRVVSETLHDSLIFRNELEMIVAVLSRHGVPCVLLKGLSLNPTLLRDTGDIDLLVPREKLLDAMDAILEIPGYFHDEQPSPWNGHVWRRHAALSPSLKARIAAWVEVNHECHMVHPGRGILVELHVALFPGGGRREEGVLGAAAGEGISRRIRARARTDPGLKCPVPQPEHSLLLMSLHVALHRSPADHVFRLSLLVDIDALAASGIRWDEFTRECADLGVCPCGLFALRLARRLLGTAVPARVLADLSRECTPLQRMLTRFHMRCARSLNGSDTLYSALYRCLEPWAFGGSWRDRLRWSLLLPLWVPRRDRIASQMGVDIHSPFLFFGYLLNPARWAWGMIQGRMGGRAGGRRRR